MFRFMFLGTAQLVVVAAASVPASGSSFLSADVVRTHSALDILDAGNELCETRNEKLQEHISAATSLADLISPIAGEIALLKRFELGTVLRDIWEEAFTAASPIWNSHRQESAGVFVEREDWPLQNVNSIKQFVDVVRTHVETVTAPDSIDAVKKAGCKKAFAATDAKLWRRYKALFDSLYRDAHFFVAAKFSAKMGKDFAKDIDFVALLEGFGFKGGDKSGLDPNADDGTKADRNTLADLDEDIFLGVERELQRMEKFLSGGPTRTEVFRADVRADGQQTGQSHLRVGDLPAAASEVATTAATGKTFAERLAMFEKNSGGKK